LGLGFAVRDHWRLESINEAIQKASYLVAVVSQFFSLASVEESELSRERDLCSQFQQGDLGVKQKRKQFPVLMSAFALGDVTWDRYGRSSHLAGQAVELLLWERSGTSIDGQSEIHGTMPHLRIFVGTCSFARHNCTTIANYGLSGL
jgi:hypothetical protein